MKENSVAIIGGGNLGQALALGFLESDLVPASDLLVTRRNLNKIDYLEKKGINISEDNRKATQYRTILLALKPKEIEKVMLELNSGLTKEHLIVSVATGVSINYLKKISAGKPAIIRAMPNTAVALRQSMTCLAAQDTDEQNIKWISDLFNAVGKTAVIDEALMSASTVLGACGIAYALRFIRAATQGGIEIGFDSETSKLIATQTVLGASKLLLENGLHPEQEIDKVTTPNGCTIVGLNEMEHYGFSSSLIRGIKTSYLSINDID